MITSSHRIAALLFLAILTSTVLFVSACARDELTAEERSNIEVFEAWKGSVVFITTSNRVVDFWTRNVMSVPRGTGSGFVWDDRGHIVTNLHVIADAAEATVKLADGRDYPASLVGVSPAHDIAVLNIAPQGKPLVPVSIGTSDDLRAGQKVFAIGNPFGLDWTLTTGIVSALDRSLDNESGGVIRHLIQTDAAINPGNSGGPLLDSAGRMIGVNTAIYSPSGASAGIGFAIPVDTVNRVVPELIRRGKYVRPGLGFSAPDDQVAAKLGVPKGVLVGEFAPNSPVAKAGLRPITRDSQGRIKLGDVIVAIDGRKVESVNDLYLALEQYKVGDTVKLTVLRDGKPVELKAQLQPIDEATG
jgi:S1-C subfamily serine protease